MSLLLPSYNVGEENKACEIRLNSEHTMYLCSPLSVVAKIIYMHSDQ